MRRVHAALQALFWTAVALLAWTQAGYPVLIALLAGALRRGPARHSRPRASQPSASLPPHPSSQPSRASPSPLPCAASSPPPGTFGCQPPAVSLIVAAHDEQSVIAAK